MCMSLFSNIPILSSLEISSFKLILIFFVLTFYVNNCIIDLCNCIKPDTGFTHELWGVQKEVYYIMEIKEIIAGFTEIPAEIDNIRTDRTMIMFEYVVPNEETIKKIETALSQFGEVQALHCRQYDIVCWVIRK